MSPSLLKDHHDLTSARAGLPDTIKEEEVHLQQIPSGRRWSQEVLLKSKPASSKAHRSSTGSCRALPSQSEDRAVKPSLDEQRKQGALQFSTIQREAPNGRCSCMIKRHYEERSKLSMDLGQDVAFSASDHSFRELMNQESPSSGQDGITSQNESTHVQPTADVPASQHQSSSSRARPHPISPAQTAVMPFVNTHVRL